MGKIRRALRYLKNNGFKRSFIRLKEKIIEKALNSKNEKIEQENYLKWIKNNEPTEEELNKQRKHVFKYSPKISIIVPMYNTPENYFLELVESIKEQTYTNWELCLADGSPQKQDFIQDVVNSDARIIYKFLNGNF